MLTINLVDFQETYKKKVSYFCKINESLPSLISGKKKKIKNDICTKGKGKIVHVNI